MMKWNLIIDVAECTNCNLCALAVQDEHVDNAFPGYAEEMPKHGHRWIEIKRRERGGAERHAKVVPHAGRALPLLRVVEIALPTGSTPVRPEGPDQYLEMIRAIDRQGFGVHIDICNGINSPQRFYNNAAFTEECFRKLGRWILSCHAKDLEWQPEMNLHFVEVVPGRGRIDYRPYLRGVASLPQDAPLMLEHLKTAEEYAEGAKYIRGVASQTGHTFA